MRNIPRAQVELYDDQWHVRTYFWCLDTWDAFFRTYTDRTKANLCSYCRSFIGAPVVLMVHVVFLAFAVYVLMYYPLTRFGIEMCLRGLGAIAISAVAFFTARYLLEKLEPWFDALAFRKSVRRAQKERIATSEKRVGFFETIYLWALAAKYAVCPTIVIHRSSNHSE